MTLASTKNNFLRQHGNPDLIHSVRFSHGVPIVMQVQVYDVVIAEETLPSYFDFPVTYSYVDKPESQDGSKFVPAWFSDFQKFDKGIASVLGEKPRPVFTSDDY
jgi:hypothetical protein